jgi:hypothetical protein
LLNLPKMQNPAEPLTLAHAIDPAPGMAMSIGQSVLRAHLKP